MNDEQREFATKNHNLIYKFLTLKKLPIFESDIYNGEDWYGVAAIGFCKAVHAYRKDSGIMFSTFAFHCMNNEVLNTYRKLNAQNKIPSEIIVHGDTPVREDNGEDFSLFDMLSSPDYSEDFVVLKLDFENYLKTLDKKKRAILELVSLGYNLQEVGNIVGVSREYARQIKNKAEESLGIK